MDTIKEENSKIKNLKIAKYAFTAIAGIASLVTTPITTGIAIASGLGALISDISLDNAIGNNKIATASR